MLQAMTFNSINKLKNLCRNNCRATAIAIIECTAELQVQHTSWSNYRIANCNQTAKSHLHTNGAERVKQSKAHQIKHTSADHLPSNICTSKYEIMCLCADLSSLYLYVVNNPHTAQPQQ
jgi:hypothetical protein